MNELRNKKLTENSRTLRKGMTSEERHLWYDFLKKLSLNVYRQKILDRYIVDFYIPKAKLVIELDGSQHYRPENKESDEERDRFLENEGLLVLRYTNRQVNEKFSEVCEDIRNYINIRKP